MSGKLALLLILITVGAWANPDAPGPASVHVIRNDTILVAQGIFAPKLLYPEGRVDFDVIEQLVDRATFSLTGKPPKLAWLQFCSPTSTVGIMIDAGRYPVQSATVEVVIDRLVNAGVQPGNIIVFSGDERDLFSAGFNVNRDAGGVRVLGADSEGFRGGLSRIVGEYCDVIINVAPLKVDPDLGMAGCVANALSCVPNVQRVALRQHPETVAQVAAHTVLRRKVKLNLLEAYLPLLDMAGQTKTTFQYKGLFAGTDMVALDVIGRQVLQACRNKQRGSEWPLPTTPDYLQAARDVYRLGQCDPKEITVQLTGYEEDSFVK